ncbi:MAG: L-histidine N(alpha)-methyltransferase, partial [Alphaproteobacteria bacterium]
MAESMTLLKEPPILDCAPVLDDFKSAVLRGLGRAQKAIPPMFFYDAVGSRLFEDICNAPEYYPTRAELALM